MNGYTSHDIFSECLLYAAMLMTVSSKDRNLNNVTKSPMLTCVTGCYCWQGYPIHQPREGMAKAELGIICVYRSFCTTTVV